MRTQSSSQRLGFSLLELLAVILIIGVVAVFVTPAITTILKGSQISQGEQILVDQFKLARQLALTRNRSIEVRFIRYGDPEIPGEKKNDPTSGGYRAIQLMEVLDSGAIVPIDKPQVLPQATILATGTLSTLLSDPTVKTLTASQSRTTDGGADPAMPRGIEYCYDFAYFRFLRDGSTDLKTTNSVVWCVTLVNMNDRATGGTLPANFVTLQIDPISGAIRIFRPSV